MYRVTTHKKGLHQVKIHGVDLGKIKRGAMRIAELPTVYKVSLSKTQITLILDSSGHLDEVLAGVEAVILEP